MKKIMFRGYSKDSDCFVYGCYLYTSDVHQIVFDSGFTSGDRVTLVQEDVDPNTICQYTGISDLNGDRVYEGDIVKVHKFVPELGENLGVTEGEKEFIAYIKLTPYGGVTLCYNDSEEGYLWEYENGFHEESIKIIGNIYENPELLEQEVSNG